ncbi:uncharacterized protein BO97DRAFT_461770 [Aspergillus homomorphus CBS 101889]|uniref:Integral membrane protein n=1 Tax=Aspergillus homomorphus (strain CBS 101889) TaxID=1450537 RepID=A0A395HLE9_ASPHC|nr:integral membrane protein [Aspergillus homomorphus CBS 101889]RAL08263.1 integral membrane protein [Aspergillus homomorphus CBS 101889]
MSWLKFILSLCYLYLAGTVFFDWMHFLLHRWSRSQWRFLRLLSRYHQYHHLYYGRLLQFNPKYTRQNTRIALPLELLCQMLGNVVGWLVAWTIMMGRTECIDRRALLIVLVIQAGRSLVVILNDGKDSNHISYDTVPKDWSWSFVGPEYHALHHRYPDRYMGSAIKLFDWVAGTAYSLRGKVVVMTGGSGEFGQAIEKQLLAEGVRSIHKPVIGKSWTRQAATRLMPMLDQADILILANCTGGMEDMESDCTLTIRLIQQFLAQKAAQKGKVLPEIWYISSEAECLTRGATERGQESVPTEQSFLPYARSLYRSSELVYRHIVPSLWKTSTGRTVISPEKIVRAMLWWVRRGAYFVPVTYTGIAYLQFLAFQFGAAADVDWSYESVVDLEWAYCTGGKRAWHDLPGGLERVRTM